MSLILEALRKLEREKSTTAPRGFLVIGGVAGPDRGLRLGRLAVALAVIAGVGLGLALWHRTGPAGATPPPTVQASPAPVRAGGVEVVPVPAPRVATHPPATAPAATAKAVRPERATPPPRLRLQAISRRDGVPVAILNDRLVREGDLFEGVRVVRIGELEVEVEMNGQRLVLSF